MPELPEVEIIKLGLQRKIIGLKVKTIQILNTKSFIGDPKKLQGKIVLNVWRRAKLLGIDLTGNLTMLFHLKMSGQIIISQISKLKSQNYNSNLKTENEMPNYHTRVVIKFDTGIELLFNDQRKFGWIKIIENGQWKMDNFVKKLGPEPLEKSFTWQVLKKNLLRHRGLPVKVVIMDQSVVAGVGNIYASEAQFLARIDPRTKVSDLTDEQVKKLHNGIIKALKAGIEYGGSTRTHFIDPEGKKGRFLDVAYVYGREGKACKICGHKIMKFKLGERGTYFCEYCQR